MTDHGSGDVPFWRLKSLEEMTDSEWESLCDGCGRCCLNKLEEEGTDRTFYTDVGCRLLDSKTCRCHDYANRLQEVDDCVQLTPQSLKTITWLPPSCAYVLLAEGKDLYWWHPLVSGDPDTVHAAGVSVRGRVSASETLRLRRYARRLHRQLAVEAAERGATEEGRGRRRITGKRWPPTRNKRNAIFARRIPPKGSPALRPKLLHSSGAQAK